MNKETQTSELLYTTNPSVSTPGILVDTAGQYPAIGRGTGCVVSLIAPNVAITAEHCVQYRNSSSPGFSVQFANGSNAPSTDLGSYAVTSIIRHPDRLATQDANNNSTCASGSACQQRRNAADVALLVLNGTPNITPMPILLSPPEDLDYWRDKTFTLFGTNNSIQIQTCTTPNGMSGCAGWTGTTSGEYCAVDTDNDGVANQWLLSAGVSAPAGSRGECRYRNDNVPLSVRDTGDFDSDGNTNELLSPRVYTRGGTFSSFSGRLNVSLSGIAVIPGDSGGPLITEIDGVEAIVGVLKSSGRTYSPTFSATTASWIAQNVPALQRADMVYLDASDKLQTTSTVNSYPSYAGATAFDLPVSGNRNQTMSKAFTVTTNHVGRIDVWAIKNNGYFYHWFKHPNTAWHHETIGSGFDTDVRPTVSRIGDGGFIVAAADSNGYVKMKTCSRNGTREGQRIKGYCGGTSGWYTSYNIEKPSPNSLRNLMSISDFSSKLDLYSNGANGLYQRTFSLTESGPFTDASGWQWFDYAISAPSAQIRLDSASRRASTTAGIAASGGFSWRRDVYYAKSNTNGVYYTSRFSGSSSWTTPYLIDGRSGIRSILHTETTDYADDPNNIRRRIGVWYSDGSRVIRSVKRYTFDGLAYPRQTFVTTVPSNGSEGGFSVSGGPFRGNNMGFFVDLARVTRPTSYIYTRNENASNPDTTFFASDSNPGLIPASTSRWEVTPWSRF